MDDGYADGRLYATTLGQFIALIVDGGPDPMVKFRVIEDTQPIDGSFARRLEITLVPDGLVKEYLGDCVAIHKTLQAMLDAGLVK